MMKLLRSQSQTVLVLVLGVLGLGFLFYGSQGTFLTNSAGGRVSNDYGRIDGDDVSVAELYDAVRNTRNSLIIHGQSQVLNRPGVSAQIAEEAWRRMLLLHEADQLHITVPDQQVIDTIKGMTLFQKNGVYDPETYLQEMAVFKTIIHVPSDSGVDPTQEAQNVFETLIKNDLRLNAVREALFNTVRSPAQEVTAQFQKYYGPVTVSIVTYDSKSLPSVSVSTADIQNEYKQHSDSPDYRSPEKRKVDYVLFMLTPDQQKLPAQQKSAAKDALGQKALDFALALQPNPSENGTTPPVPDFVAEAKKEGLTPVTSDFFTADATPAGVPPSPAFNSAAFALTNDNTVSKVVDMDNGVALLHLNTIQPSELRPLADVQSIIQKKLEDQNNAQALRVATEIADKTLQNQVKQGVAFSAAAAKLGLKVETLPAFVPVKSTTADARTQAAAYATVSLSPGDVSDPIPVQGTNSQMIIHLDKRDQASQADFADFEKRFRQSQDEQLRQQVSVDWTEWKSQQPGTHKPPDLDMYGSVE